MFSGVNGIASELIITFRETLEAALVVGIVLAYLKKTDNNKYIPTVYWGIGLALMGSIITAVIFNIVAGGFSGKAEEIFEGVMMITATALLTTMILWMMKQRHKIADHIKEKISKHVENSHKFGIFALVFVAVLREGVETVIFLSAAARLAANNAVLAVSGVVFAIALGYGMFALSKRINLRKFFNVSSILLILFAAGLFAHGIHEFQEAGLLPYGMNEVWDINPAAPLSASGIYPLLHEKGAIGSILKGLFGYNGNPSLLEVLGYLAYLGIIAYLWIKIEKSFEKQAAAVSSQ